MQFEQLGFYKEFYVGSKFIGSINNCQKDREVIGYEGKQQETLQQEITLDNGRKLKKNTQVITMVYPLCGKISR